MSWFRFMVLGLSTGLILSTDICLTGVWRPIRSSTQPTRSTTGKLGTLPYLFGPRRFGQRKRGGDSEGRYLAPQPGKPHHGAEKRLCESLLVRGAALAIREALRCLRKRKSLLRRQTVKIGTLPYLFGPRRLGQRKRGGDSDGRYLAPQPGKPHRGAEKRLCEQTGDTFLFICQHQSISRPYWLCGG